MDGKLTKEKLAKILDISRPTLDKYLKEGFPTSYKYNFSEDISYKKINLENEIRICEYKLLKLKEELKELEKID